MSQVTEYVFPTSFAQRRLWFLDSLQPGSAVYNVPTALQLDGPLDATAFVRAYDAMLERHEILRTVFRLEQGEPVQIVSESPHPQSRLQLMDLTDRSPDEALALARDLGAQEAARPFDLANGPLIRGRLIRVAAERHLLFVTMHHIVTDAWSRGVLYRELAAHYAAQMEGTPADLPALEVQYADYAIWQRDRLSNGRADELVDYWRRQLAPPVAPFELPTDRPRPPIQTFAGAWLAVPVPDEVAAGFLALCRSERVTLFAAAYAAYSALLHRHTGQSDIVVGTPIAGRPGPEVEALIGFFVNSLALRTEVRPVEGFREHLRRSARVAVDAFEHQDVPFEKLVEELAPERDRSRNPFFQTVLVVNHAGEGGFSLPGIRVTGLRTGDHETAKFDLTVFLIQHDERLALGFEYNTDLFDRDTVRRLGERLVVLIRGAVAHPDTPIERLAILPDAERRLIVETWSGRHTGYRRNATIHELFAEQARRTPNEIAVSWGGNRLSYRELDAKSSRLAAHLRGLGVAPGDCVGLCHERAPGLVVGLLGILKAGGAYVPLDRAYPDARLSYMMAEARIDIVVTDGRRDVPEGPRLVSLPDVLAGPDCEDRAGPAAGVNAESLAYVIFTSGSTGEPKGVAVPHRAVVRLVDQTDFLQIRPGDRVLGFAPISFDASTFEVWAPLLNGATAVVFPPTSPSLAELGRFIEREQVTVAWLTAALFNQMVDAELPRLRGLRALLAGGDVLSVPHVRRVLQELPGVQLINGYGPTENTTFTCCHRITTADLGRGSISIGRPIANTTVYVLDRTSQPVPIGVAGELYTGGDGVALGYLHRPELTAERFLADPFAGGSARLYRTGDQVRWRPDGTIEFLGRLDQQVKIRGFRIEPGEIEAALVAHPDVREAVVVVRPDARGDKRLVAYVIGRAGLPDAAALKAHCAARLPDFMVPATVVGLTALPVTPNGKVDRAALPHPGSAEEPAPAHGTPHTTLEA
ncbi:MAG: non-ribosomal peptide synthetase, partial [Gemmatimonadales bacterium]